MGKMGEKQVLQNSFHRISEFEWLERAYRKARKQKRYREEILAFSNNLDANLLQIQEQLRNGTFRFGPYRRHWVYVPKKRLVMALPFPSRVVQWAIYLELMPFYDRLMIEDSYACRKGKKAKRPEGSPHKVAEPGQRMNKGSLAAAKRLQYWLEEVEGKPGNWYVLKMDISKYFYRIDHEVLLSILGERIKDDDMMNLLRTIICCGNEKFGLPRFTSPDDLDPDEWLSDVGMPIGNLTSQMFANIYLNELDQFAKHVLKIHKYARYMDDVVCIAPDKETAHKWEEAIAEFLKERLHLDLNKKTSIRPVGKVEFVGYIVSAKCLRLRKATTRRIKRAFRGICKKYFAGKMTKAEFDRRVASYSGMIKECKADALKDRLNEIYLHAKEVQENKEKGGYAA